LQGSSQSGSEEAANQQDRGDNKESGPECNSPGTFRVSLSECGAWTDVPAVGIYPWAVYFGPTALMEGGEKVGTNSIIGIAVTVIVAIVLIYIVTTLL
jgi:hypothetical protein